MKATSQMLALVALLAMASAAQAQDKAAEKKAEPGAAAKGAKTEADWWGHAAWVVRTPGGATLAIDPWLTNPKAPKDAKWPEQVDAILITHGHFDHVGDAVALQKKTGAMVVGAFELVSQLGVGDKGNGGNMGGTVEVKDAKIHLVEAVHSSGMGGPESKGPPTYGGNPMGYVIEIANGPTIYHAGDTDTFGDMALIAERYHPTIAMLPIGGHFTMDPKGAALAAKLLKVKTVIPMHYGTFPALTGTPEELQKELKAQKVSATVVVAEPGKSLQL